MCTICRDKKHADNDTAPSIAGWQTRFYLFVHSILQYMASSDKYLQITSLPSFSGLSKYPTATSSTSYWLTARIENYGILIATCAPVIRLFLRTFVDMRREGRYGGYPWSRSHSSNPHNSNENSSSSGQQEIEMKRGNKFQQRFNLSRTDGSRVDPDKTFDSLFDDSYLLNTVDDESKHVPSAAGPSHTINLVARMPSPVNSRDTRHSTGVGVTVKTDIVVEVDEELGMSRGSESSSQSKDGHLYPTFTLQDDQSWVERHASAYVWKTSNQWLIMRTLIKCEGGFCWVYIDAGYFFHDWAVFVYVSLAIDISVYRITV